MYIYIYTYIITSYAFFFENVKNIKSTIQHLKIWLYFDFYKTSMEKSSIF